MMCGCSSASGALRWVSRCATPSSLCDWTAISICRLRLEVALRRRPAQPGELGQERGRRRRRGRLSRRKGGHGYENVVVRTCATKTQVFAKLSRCARSQCRHGRLRRGFLRRVYLGLEVWRSSAPPLARCGPISTSSWRIRAQNLTILADFGRCWPKFIFGPNLARIRPTRAVSGPSFAKSGDVRQKLWPNLGRLRLKFPTVVRVRPMRGESGPRVSQLWPKFGRLLAEVRQVSPGLGQTGRTAEVLDPGREWCSPSYRAEGAVGRCLAPSLARQALSKGCRSQEGPACGLHAASDSVLRLNICAQTSGVDASRPTLLHVVLCWLTLGRWPTSGVEVGPN